MVNMPAYEITLTSLILKFLLQSKDSLFLSTIIQCTRIHVCVCTYICVGVCARACDCTCMQMDTFTALTPKRCELMVFITCVHLYVIYPEYIFHIYHESTGFDNSQNGGQNSHGDYKNTVSKVECRIQ